MLERSEWCSVCNSRPADGILTVILDDIEEPQDIPACEICVIDKTKVVFE